MDMKQILFKRDAKALGESIHFKTVLLDCCRNLNATCQSFQY